MNVMHQSLFEILAVSLVVVEEDLVVELPSLSQDRHNRQYSPQLAIS